ncbi:MAG: hypothetical protein B0A82_17365 [Alkalinema sp. CACIAM 70d]|nr:MAG: hypothetical protein B0A82_17365 [Alkalinema sp. CACIAM 70d]
MPSKDEIQSTLKNKYGINKNITQPLSKEDCERLLYLLSREDSAVKLVQSYASKNASLGSNNAAFGRARSQAEHKLEVLKAEYLELEKSVSSIEDAKLTLETRKVVLEEERKALELEVSKRKAVLEEERKALELEMAKRKAVLEEERKALELEMAKRKAALEEERKALELEVTNLTSSNQVLSSKVQTLTTQNDELTTANTQLKKENKDLKNIVDQIRLRLAKDTKELLKYEDSQIRKAVIKLFQWTLG